MLRLRSIFFCLRGANILKCMFAVKSPFGLNRFTVFCSRIFAYEYVIRRKISEEFAIALSERELLPRAFILLFGMECSHTTWCLINEVQHDDSDNKISIDTMPEAVLSQTATCNYYMSLIVTYYAIRAYNNNSCIINLIEYM